MVGLRRVDGGEDLAVGAADVGRVQRSVEAQDQQPVDRRRVGAGDLDVGDRRGSTCSSVTPDAVELVDDEEQGEHHADGDGGEQAEAQPARRR